MTTDKKHDWRALCQAVSVEHNSERLQNLLTELLKTMEESPAGQATNTVAARS